MSTVRQTEKRFITLSRILGLFWWGMIFCSAIEPAWAGRLVITGSTTVKPIVTKIAESYRAVNSELEIDIAGGGSGNGIKAIIDGTTDIGTASRFIKGKELEYAHGKGVYPVPFQIAYDCIVPIVHPQNGIKDLTIAQLRKIYLGLIDNWSLVGGRDMPIKVISRDTSSGTYEIWEKRVMWGQPVLPAAHLESSNKRVVEKIASDINAIGYIGLGYLNDEVRPVKVNHIFGSAKNSINGTYCLSRPLFIFTRGWPSGDTLKFIKYAMDPDNGQKDISATGFIALYRASAAFSGGPSTTSQDPNYVDEEPINIEMIQEYLMRLGYDVGPVDGIKGGKTMTAIVAFQRRHNLPLEWRISRKMAALLSKQYMQTIRKVPESVGNHLKKP